MGRRGPAAKTIEQHREDGTYRRSRHGDLGRHALVVTVEDGPEGLERFTPPAHLSEAQAAAWEELYAPVAASGLLTESDLGAFEVMAVALATFRDANLSLGDAGLTVETPNGYAIANPLLGIRDKAAKEYLAGCKLFGFSPADRASLGGTVAKGLKAAAGITAKIGESPRTIRKRAADAAKGDA